MSNETQITITGNLTDDPQIKFTGNGTPVASFRVASTPRFMKDGQWQDGESLFLTCNVWRQTAENVTESLARGMRVIVAGRLKQREYEKDGQKRVVYEIEVDDVGPSLKNATAKVIKAGDRSRGSDEAPF